MLCLTFLNMQACESWKVEERATQPAWLGIQIRIAAVPRALQACVKARQIPGTWFVFTFPSPQAGGSYKHGAIVHFRRIQDTYVYSSVVCQLLLARDFSVALQRGEKCVHGTASLCWKPRC